MNLKQAISELENYKRDLLERIELTKNSKVEQKNPLDLIIEAKNREIEELKKEFEKLKG